MMKLARNKFVFVGLSAFSCFILQTTEAVSVKLGTEDYNQSF
jgi:hypothetical protein